jgi:hypothetical protein
MTMLLLWAIVGLITSPQYKHKPPSKRLFFSCVISGLYHTASICISSAPECELEIVVEAAKCGYLYFGEL